MLKCLYFIFYILYFIFLNFMFNIKIKKIKNENRIKKKTWITSGYLTLTKIYFSDSI